MVGTAIDDTQDYGLGFLLFVYLSAMIILVRVELSAQWPRVDIRDIEKRFICSCRKAQVG